MRFFVEILIAAGLIAAAWQTPYRERLGELIPALAAAPSGSRAVAVKGEEQHRLADPQPVTAPADQPAQGDQRALAASSSAPSGNWMWDPKRPGSLDRPGQTATPTVFTKHIYYQDEKGKKYWLDAQGRRHYD